MGQTLTTWIADVSEIIRDATNTSVSQNTVERRGVIPALTQYAIDRPRTVVVEQAGSGSPYQPLPSTGAGWVPGFSRVTAVEYPARRTPRELLDVTQWAIARDPAVVATERLLLADLTPAASEWVRIEFTTRYPAPTSDATVDQVDDVAYHAVTHLAAALVLHHLAAGAARTRQGLLATTAREGDGAAQTLRDAADDLRAVYATFLGLQAAGAAATGGPATPAYAALDWNPGWGSLFHGGRR